MSRDRSLWQVIRPKLAFCKRHLVWFGLLVQTPPKQLLWFRCNICGHRSAYPRDRMTRDIASCHFCGSHVRWRSVIHALSLELFGKSLAIPDFPHRPDLLGIGLSDWDGYASRLAKKLRYTNTFYHQEPFLDITDIGSNPTQYDFLITSDVFEHVCQPIERVFQNACKLLKPGGLMILTVPYVEGHTAEHFPEVCRFTIAQKGETWVLHGTTSDGSARTYPNLTFHGGPGTVVECRLFGRESLMQQCIDAGFSSVRIHDEAAEEFGIRWNPYIPEDAPYRPLIYGLDTPPWAVSRAPVVPTEQPPMEALQEPV